MTEIIGEEWNKQEYDEFVFPELTKFILEHLPNFERLSFDDAHAVITPQHQSSRGPKLLVPKLEESSIRWLQVDSCGESALLFPCAVVKNLQELIVIYCPLLEEVDREDSNIYDIPLSSTIYPNSKVSIEVQNMHSICKH